MPGLIPFPAQVLAALAVLLEKHGHQERDPRVGSGWGGGTTNPCTLTPAEQEQNNGGARIKARLFYFIYLKKKKKDQNPGFNGAAQHHKKRARSSEKGGALPSPSAPAALSPATLQ